MKFTTETLICKKCGFSIKFEYDAIIQHKTITCKKCNVKMVNTKDSEGKKGDA
jgi:hypothetical protein